MYILYCYRFIMIKNNLPNLLRDKKLNQKKLSELTGITFSVINNLYNNKTESISFSVASKICEALDCNIEDLFEFVSQKKSRLVA